MPAERIHHLAIHARQRHEQALHRAQQTLTEMADTGQPVTVTTLATQAGVSRSWIYTQPELQDQIRQLQHHRNDADLSRNNATRASDESLRRRLAFAHEQITELRTENQHLREALAYAHGQLRAARIATQGQQ
jgi:hypothetical protein